MQKSLELSPEVEFADKNTQPVHAKHLEEGKQREAFVESLKWVLEEGENVEEETPALDIGRGDLVGVEGFHALFRHDAS